jgi:hypothetical protein
MKVSCHVCGSTFDHRVTGIDWHNQLFLCWPCNDAGYDITSRGEITLHDQPQRSYNSAVTAYSPASTVALGTLQARELAIIEQGTDAINRGMSSQFNWALVIGGLVGMPFTGGLSFALTLIGGIRMSGSPKHMVNAAIPKTVDSLAPKAGCVRMLAALGSLLFALGAIGLFLLLVAYQAGMLGVR